jgi:hypothetical protein
MRWCRVKELAPFKELASLGLVFTKVTDAGLKEREVERNYPFSESGNRTGKPG